MEKVACDGPDCTNDIPNHRWSKIKADDWFFSEQTGKAYCPDHIPEWVAGWRARRDGQSL